MQDQAAQHNARELEITRRKLAELELVLKKAGINPRNYQGLSSNDSKDRLYSVPEQASVCKRGGAPDPWAGLGHPQESAVRETRQERKPKAKTISTTSWADMNYSEMESIKDATVDGMTQNGSEKPDDVEAGGSSGRNRLESVPSMSNVYRVRPESDHGEDQDTITEDLDERVRQYTTRRLASSTSLS